MALLLRPSSCRVLSALWDKWVPRTHVQVSGGPGVPQRSQLVTVELVGEVSPSAIHIEYTCAVSQVT